MLDVIGFLLVGKLLVWVLQKFPMQKLFILGRFFEPGKFLRELFECQLCLGVWVFWGLSFITKTNFVTLLFGRSGLYVFDQWVTGAIASFVVYVFSVGWTTLFSTIVLE